MASDCLADFGRRWDRRRNDGPSVSVSSVLEFTQLYLKQAAGQDFHRNFVDMQRCMQAVLQLHNKGGATTILGVQFLRLLGFVVKLKADQFPIDLQGTISNVQKAIHDSMAITVCAYCCLGISGAGLLWGIPVICF